MKPELAASFAAAVLLHALILFGFKLETSAHPLAMSDQPYAVDVSLVQAPPEPAAQAGPSATPVPAPPAPTPEPPEPTPAPTPPEPQPTPDVSTPAPEATPEQEEMPASESTPAPHRAKAAPHHSPQKHGRASAAHSSAGTSTAAGRPSERTEGAANGQLSSHPRYLSNPRPDYPAEARAQHQEGVVIVTVQVGTNGRAGGVTLAQGSGYPLLDEAALEAVRRWRFEPAEAGGLPVSSRVDVPVRFSLDRR